MKKFSFAVGLAVFLSAMAAQAQSRQAAITSFYDFSYPGGLHVVYQGNDGQINDYYWPNGSGGWHFGRVSSVPGNNAGQLISYSDGTNNHVFGIKPVNGSPHIVEWWGQGVPTNFSDLTANAIPSGPRLNPQGTIVSCYGNQSCVQNPASLAGYWDGLGVEHIFYTATDNEIHELYHYNGNWWDHSLGGQAANAQNREGLAAMIDGTSALVQHVFYNGSDAHLHELYYYNSNWLPNDWTNWGGTAPLSATGYVAASWDTQSASTNVFAVGNNGQLQEFVHSNSFHASSVTMPNFGSGQSLISYDYITSPCPSMEPACTPGTQLETAYHGFNNQIYEVNGASASQIAPNGSGACRSTSYYVDPGSPIAGFYDSGSNFRHIYFIGGDASVNELVAYPNQGWTLNNLDCFSGVTVSAQQ